MSYLDNMIIEDVCAAVRLNVGAGVALTRNDRKRCGVVLKTKGRTVYKQGNREFISDSNHACILPKGSTYSFVCEEEGECLMLEMDVKNMGTGIECIRINNMEEMKNLFARIEYTLDFSGGKISAFAGAYAMLEKLIEQHYAPRKDKTIIGPAIKYIEESLHLPNPTNEKLAQLCGISCVYFRKIFKNIYNMPPSRYITLLKIQRAKGLILGDFVSMGEIAAACGFSSIYHFSKVFTAVAGMTPTEYKRINRN